MGLRDSLDNIDHWLDRKLDKVPDLTGRKKERPEEYERRIKARLDRARFKTGTTLKSLDDYGDRVAGKVTERMKKKGGIEGFYTSLLNRPIVVIVVVFVITGLIATQATAVLNNMRGEMEIYLPTGHPSTITLQEVNEDWTTDVITLWVKARDLDGDGRRDNVTRIDILKEISFIEGDDTNQDNTNWKYRGLDYNRGDNGTEDGVMYVLSLSSLIKTINESASYISEAIHNEFPVLPRVADLPGNYSIPSQEVVDTIVDGLDEEQKGSLIKDVDGDGITETMVVVIGIKKGVNPSKMVERVDKILDARMKGLGYDNPTAKITNTGPYTVIEKMQGRTVFEFMKILPFLILFLIGVLFFFHRSIKIAIIALIPVALALGMTLGIIGILSNVAPDVVIISPQIALIVPIMLALGVAYGLYIANRFAEEKKGSKKKRMVTTVKAMNNAIFLSAFTTSIGFASLMIGTLPPIFAMGLALAIGILLTYFITMVVTPPMVMLLGYEKKKEFAAWGGFASKPSQHRKKILAVALIFTFVSCLTIPYVKFDADYLAMMPEDDPAILAMDEYSKQMGGGMIGMIIVRANASEYSTLKTMETVEGGINQVKNSQCLSIIDIMKAIRTPEEITIPGIGYDVSIPANTSYWELVERQGLYVPGHGSSQNMFIRIFYDVLGPEMKYMFVNNDRYEKSLIYVFMPYLDVEESRKAVNGVDKVVEDWGYPPGGTMSKLTGVAPLILAINDLIILSQFQTLALCIFLSFVVLTIVFRSWKMGLLTMIPCVLVVSYEPATMVGLNIPLSIITVMIGSIAIGTGVDFSIQISQRIKLMGMGLTQIRNAVEHMGISFVEATMTMVIGFSAVLVAPWPGAGPFGLPFTLGVGIASVREFVLMIMILLSFNATMAILVLPALYTMWIRFKRAEELKEKEVAERAKRLEKEEPLSVDLVDEVDAEDEVPQIY